MIARRLFVSAFIFISINAFAFSTGFGVKGRRGFDGESGRDGRSGQPTQLVTTGDYVSRDVQGENGTDGRDGRNGENAYDCKQPQDVADDLYGADGGIGGNAGNGGEGGRGGDVQIYTNDLRNLSRVYVNAAGGRGGRSGRPGLGGRPCYCSVRTWVIKKCEQANGTDVCKDVSFKCHDGDLGREGIRGVSGREGRPGHVTVIPQLQPLAPTQPNLYLHMTDILSGPFTLSENVWQTRYGATQVLAPGSRVDDTYSVFDHRQEYSISFDWRDSRPLAFFSKYTVNLSASPQAGRAVFSVSPDVWFDADEQFVSGGAVHVTFKRVILKAEAEQLRLSVSGSDSGLLAYVDDAANMSDVIQTGFNVVLKRDGFWTDKTLYEGSMPASLVEKSGNRWILKIGQLPLVDMSALKRGQKILLKVDVARGLGQFSLVKKLEAKYKIP